MNRRKALKSMIIAGGVATTAPSYATSAIGKKSRLKVGLIGCSGRGVGAVTDMLEAAKGKVQIVAIADLFPDRVSYAMERFGRRAEKYGKDKFDIPKSRQFTGWDAYKQLLAIDEIDIVIHATPPVFRPLHLRAIVEAGKHMFVEKPACVDPVQARELLEIADMADKKNLTIIPGIQRRFNPAYIEAINRLHDGQIGEIVAAQAYWLNARFFIQNAGNLYLQNPDPQEMEYQIRNWFIFRWTSGDCYVEQHVHNLDVMLWGLGKKPKEVLGVGGRRWDIPFPEMGDRFSHFSVDYDFGEGLHCASYSRRENKAANHVMERFIGTKGVLELDAESGLARITGQRAWEAKKGLPSALVEEHRVLLDCVFNNSPKNMLREMVNSTLMAIAGRESCYSGRRFKYEFIEKKSKQSLVPDEWKFGKKPVQNITLPGEYKLS